MIKPRHLPPAHKNQMFVAVQSIGFPSNSNSNSSSSSTSSTSPQPSYHTPRHHEVTKKRLPKPKPSGILAPPPSLKTPDENNVPTTTYSTCTNEDRDDADGNFPLASSLSASPQPTLTTKDSVKSLFHIRGRASFPDVTKTDSARNVRKTGRAKRASKTPTPAVTSAEERDDDDDGVVSKNDNAGLTTFLTEDPTTTRPRNYDNRSVSCSPVLECSKYNVIGQPRYRKLRPRPSMWTLPRIDSGTKSGFGNADRLKDNSIDLRSIYGSKSKVYQVPAAPVQKEDTVILPPLQIGNRLHDAEVSVDYNSLAEKRLVMQNTPLRTKASLYRSVVKDHVAFPTSYRHYFRFRQRQHKFIRSLFVKDDFWENNPKPVNCSRCIHQTTATIHYCDVLGKRFCHFCSENTNRSFSNAYENNRMLMPSPNKSPTLQMVSEEPSFIGVRKIVITKKTKDEGQSKDQDEAEGQGEDQDEAVGQGEDQDEAEGQGEDQDEARGQGEG